MSDEDMPAVLSEAFELAQVRRGQLAEIRALSELMIRDVASAHEKSEEVRAKWKEASGETSLNILNIHIDRLFRATAALLHQWHITEASTVLATIEALLAMSEDEALVDFYTSKITEYQSKMIAFARDKKELLPLEVEGLRHFARSQLNPLHQSQLDRQIKR